MSKIVNGTRDQPLGAANSTLPHVVGGPSVGPVWSSDGEMSAQVRRAWIAHPALYLSEVSLAILYLAPADRGARLLVRPGGM